MKRIINQLPSWTLVVSGIIALLELLVSLALCIAPESVVEDVDLSAKGVDYLVYIWAVRQFALGVIFAFATWKRSVPMLTIAYIFFLVMMIGDFLMGIHQGNSSLILAALIMSVVSGLLIYAINKLR